MAHWMLCPVAARTPSGLLAKWVHWPHEAAALSEKDACIADAPMRG